MAVNCCYCCRFNKQFCDSTKKFLFYFSCAFVFKSLTFDAQSFNVNNLFITPGVEKIFLFKEKLQLKFFKIEKRFGDYIFVSKLIFLFLQFLFPVLPQISLQLWCCWFTYWRCQITTRSTWWWCSEGLLLFGGTWRFSTYRRIYRWWPQWL